MERFFKHFNGKAYDYYPVSEIIGMLPTVAGGLKIFFNNSDMIDPVCVDPKDVRKVIKEIRGSRFAVSYIDSASLNLYNVYQDDDGTYVAEKADHLVMCADGEIRAVEFLDGYQEFCEEMSNYRGLYERKSLKYNFKNLQFEWGDQDDSTENK